MNQIRLFPNQLLSPQLVSPQLLACVALVTLSTILVAATSAWAQSSTSTRPKQGSSSTQGSSSNTFPPRGSGGSSTSFPTQRSDGSSTKLPTQRSDGSATRGGPGDQSETEPENSYIRIVQAIQNNESRINDLYSSIPIGYPEKQKTHMAQIESLKAENVKLKSLLDVAAMEAYQKSPQKNPRVGRLIYRKMLQKMDPSGPELNFDPAGALEIANVLINGGLDSGETPGAIRFQDVAYQAFRASYAIQDFGRADLMLNKIAEKGIKVRADITDELVETRERWQRELKIRRLERNTDDLPKVQFETTEGTFLVELFENNAPDTVGNFIDLVEKKFYNDMPFFLVRPGDFVQTGCPNGDGTGDAGYSIACECFREQIRHNFTGTLSMVHKGEHDTGGSQFFISHQPNQKWDRRYTAFGRVKEGMDVVYRLKTVDKTTTDLANTEPSKIIKATVLWKRAHKYEGKRIQKVDNDIQPPTDSADATGLAEPTGPLDPADFLNQPLGSSNKGG